MLETESPKLDDLVAFAQRYRRHFRRNDQVRWFGTYLWGLIQANGRRSIESIARSLPPSYLQPGTSAAQSLQHFLTRSNWDETSLLGEMLRGIDSVGEQGACWVIHEVVYLKRGKQSVGVHRQFCRDHGIKTNSQTAVMISQVGPSGFIPLVIRLYLPRGWLEQARPEQIAEIPHRFRGGQTKEAIGIELLQGLIERVHKPEYVIAYNGMGGGDAQQAIAAAGLVSRSWNVAGDRAEQGRDWLRQNLGLDHFEGRSWRGWHRHAAAVLAAYWFLLETGARRRIPAQPNPIIPSSESIQAFKTLQI